MSDILKQKFNCFYEKRKSFYERHINLASKIGFTNWQINEFYQYFLEGVKNSPRSSFSLFPYIFNDKDEVI